LTTLKLLKQNEEKISAAIYGEARICSAGTGAIQCGYENFLNSRYNKALIHW